MRNGKKTDKWVYWWENGLIESKGSYSLGKKMENGFTMA